MEFAFGFRLSPRWFRKSFSSFTPISVTSLPGTAGVQPKDWAGKRKASNVRRRVLRRDHYRSVGVVIKTRRGDPRSSSDPS